MAKTGHPELLELANRFTHVLPEAGVGAINFGLDRLILTEEARNMPASSSEAAIQRVAEFGETVPGQYFNKRSPFSSSFYDRPLPTSLLNCSPYSISLKARWWRSGLRPDYSWPATC